MCSSKAEIVVVRFSLVDHNDNEAYTMLTVGFHYNKKKTT